MITPIEIFRALADPTRLRIVALLRAMELSVGELAHVLGQSQPRVSRHVKILCDCSITVRRREGSWIFLGPGDPKVLHPLFAALDHLAGMDEGDGTARADSQRLAAVRADRAAFAERYFADHAEDWDAIRSLHVSEAAVEAGISAALPEKIGCLVDIGTGTGRMIALLAGRATEAIGIDRSPEMLRLARAKLAGLGNVPIDLRQGDINAMPLPDNSANTVILHQVLHYLPEPDVAFLELGRITAPGGTVLLIDFAPHEREELRERNAHAKLGFSDTQITGWFALAGLECDLTDELAGDPLTVKIWRGIKRGALSEANS